MPEEIRLDMNSLTLGELAAAESASGIDSSILLSKSAHRRILSVFVHRLRSSGKEPSWHELSDLRLLDVPFSTLPSEQDSPSPKSPA
jgi:hypothetical protein